MASSDNMVSWFLENDGHCRYDQERDFTQVPYLQERTIKKIACRGADISHVHLHKKPGHRAIPLGCSWNYAFMMTTPEDCQLSAVERAYDRRYTLHAINMHQDEYKTPHSSIKERVPYVNPWLIYPEPYKMVRGSCVHNNMVCVVTHDKLEVLDVSDSWKKLVSRDVDFRRKQELICTMNGGFVAIYQEPDLYLFEFDKDKNFVKRCSAICKEGSGFCKGRCDCRIVTIPNLKAIHLSSEISMGFSPQLAVVEAVQQADDMNIEPDVDCDTASEKEAIEEVLYGDIKETKNTSKMTLLDVSMIMEGKAAVLAENFLDIVPDTISFTNRNFCAASSSELTYTCAYTGGTLNINQLFSPVTSMLTLSSDILLVHDYRNNVYVHGLKESTLLLTLLGDQVTRNITEIPGAVKPYNSLRVFSDRIFVLLPNGTLCIVKPFPIREITGIDELVDASVEKEPLFEHLPHLLPGTLCAHEEQNFSSKGKEEDTSYRDLDSMLY